MNDLIRKIEEKGYKVNEHKNFIMGRLKRLELTNPVGNTTLFECSDEPVYFVYGIKGVTKNNVEEYVERGDVLKCSKEDIYAAYYSNMPREEVLEACYEYSYRAIMELKKERESIGWRNMNQSDNEILLKDSILMTTNSKRTPTAEVGYFEDGSMWCVKTSVTARNEIFYENHFFYDIPYEESANKALLLQDIEYALMDKLFISETYNCKDCGKEIFWLDVADNIYDAYTLALNRKCGCNQ